VQWAVLLENSDSESEDHARAPLRGAAGNRARGRLRAGRRGGREPGAGAAALWHIRESIPLAQAEEGLNIKHDISVPMSRIPAFVEQTDALLQREIPGVRLVNFGHLGDGNLHYNVQAPEGGDAKAFLRDQEDRVNHLVYDAVAQFGGSFSAEHGVGALKTDKLARYQSPVALP
jgi:FAD/FMN-containing dehydrogenase